MQYSHRRLILILLLIKAQLRSIGSKSIISPSSYSSLTSSSSSLFHNQHRNFSNSNSDSVSNYFNNFHNKNNSQNCSLDIDSLTEQYNFPNSKHTKGEIQLSDCWIKEDHVIDCICSRRYANDFSELPTFDFRRVDFLLEPFIKRINHMRSQFDYVIQSLEDLRNRYSKSKNDSLSSSSGAERSNLIKCSQLVGDSLDAIQSLREFQWESLISNSQNEQCIGQFFFHWTCHSCLPHPPSAPNNVSSAIQQVSSSSSSSSPSSSSAGLHHFNFLLRHGGHCDDEDMEISCCFDDLIETLKNPWKEAISSILSALKIMKNTADQSEKLQDCSYGSKTEIITLFGNLIVALNNFREPFNYFNYTLKTIRNEASVSVKGGSYLNGLVDGGLMENVNVESARANLLLVYKKISHHWESILKRSATDNNYFNELIGSDLPYNQQQSDEGILTSSGSGQFHNFIHGITDDEDLVEFGSGHDLEEGEFGSGYPGIGDLDKKTDDKDDMDRERTDENNNNNNNNKNKDDNKTKPTTNNNGFSFDNNNNNKKPDSSGSYPQCASIYAYLFAIFIYFRLFN